MERMLRTVKRRRVINIDDKTWVPLLNFLSAQAMPRFIPR
jgi:hypothetical protein